MTAPASIDDYIAGFPAEVQQILQRIRRTMLDGAPGTTEAISYGIPTLMLDGRYLLYFAGWKRHVSIYPAPAADEALARDMAPYAAAKSTLQFPLRQPMPYELIGRIAAAALAARRGD